MKFLSIVDLVSSRLYWTDGAHIQTSDLEREDLSSVHTTTVRHSTALTVYHNTLYWAECMGEPKDCYLYYCWKQ